MGKSLQNDLNRIVNNADASSSNGWKYILTETTQSLLQHLDYCFSLYSSVDVKQSIEDAEDCFIKYSKEEREKFDDETLVNVNNVRRRVTSLQGQNDCMTKYLVATILVAGLGELELPIIKNREDLKEALQKLSSISQSKLKAVEVLWTPQEENDTLSEKKMNEDFSLLKPLRM